MKRLAVALSAKEQDQIQMRRLRTTIINALNLGRIHSWQTLYDMLGLSQQEMEYVGYTKEFLLQQKPTREQVKALLAIEEQRKEQNERLRRYSEHNYQRTDTYLQNSYGDFGEYTANNGTIKATSTRDNNEDTTCSTSPIQGQSDNSLPATEAEASKTSNTISEEVTKASKTLAQWPSWTPATQHPLQKAKLWQKQEEAAAQIYDNIVTRKFRGQLMQAPTGAGKTFVIGAIVRRLYDNGWQPLKDAISPWPIVYITKSAIVEQTERVLHDLFGLDIINQIKVLNIEQLRAGFGEMFIDWETLVESGSELERPVWKQGIHPILFIWDECHIVKNTDTQQSLIAQDVNNIERRYGTQACPVEVYQLFASATPFTRVCEAKCFAVATHCNIADFNTVGKKVELTNNNWLGFSKSIAMPFAPDEHSPKAIDQLVQYMLPYIVDIKGLRPQFHPINRVEIIDFHTPEEAKQYEVAWETYLKEKAELEADSILSGGELGMMILAQFTIFRKKAEWIRAPRISSLMFDAVQHGFAAVGAFCFKTAITRAVLDLIENHGVARNQISIIWGGAQSNGIKAKIKKVRKSFSDRMTPDEQKKFIFAMQEAGMDMAEIQEMLDDTVGWEQQEVLEKGSSYNYDKAKLSKYNLLVQTKASRQEEIDRFQSGKSLYCFFTFKAGGVGLSLHHSDDLTKEKVIKHPNGDWALESSIPAIPVRPRKTFVTPTFSAIELVQGLGRPARLTSLSDTEQTILFYKNTIEHKVACIVSTKLKCLKKVVRAKESWDSVILNPDKEDNNYNDLPKDLTTKVKTQPQQDKPDDEDDDVFISTTEED